MTSPQTPVLLNFLLLWTLNFVQFVSGPTHHREHTLDQVFVLGLTIPSLSVKELEISDNLSIRFSTMFSTVPKPQPPVSHTRTITPLKASNFMDAYLASLLCCDSVACLPVLSAKELISYFNSTCEAILDTAAPFKFRNYKTVTQPWLNNYTYILRQSCRQTERKWKKDRLQVSYGIFRSRFLDYQKAVKEAGEKYFVDIISKNSHSPRVLFNRVNFVLNPAAIACHLTTSISCDDF